MKKIILTSDHAGIELRKALKKHVESKGYNTIDLGPNKIGVSVSYADKGIELAKRVSQNDNEIGIAICGTGLGISCAVNRVKNIRGTRMTTKEDAYFARKHNDANVAVFGARQISIKKAKKIIDEFLLTKFEGGRHIKRIKQLDK
jgi:ribose 5-phosphate isomerase B